MKVMKRGLFASLAVIALLAVIVGIVYAFTIGNVDGVWGDIDGVTATDGRLTGLDVIGGYDGNTGYPTDSDHRYVRNTGICGGDPDGDISFAQYTHTTTPVWTNLGSHNPTPCTSLTRSLIISEYVYGNVYGADYIGIEIYNGGTTSINLSAYSILLFSGRTTFREVELNSFNLAAGNTYVLVSDDADDDLTIPTVNQVFNSDSDDYRAVVLVLDSTPTEGARCNRWATGNGNTPNVLSGWDRTVQNLITTDENQVRYGRDAFYTTFWNSLSCQITNFANQSGFGFDGSNGPITPVANVPFYLGRFTHYNNQVYSTDDGGDNGNAFNTIPLTVTVPVLCNDGSTPSPATFTFTPTFTLDETSNSAGTCDYGSEDDVPCPDKVTVSMPTSGGSFTCPDGDYTVVINGFTTEGLNEGEDCDVTYNKNAVSSEFITQEDQDNHACLWASITAPTSDIAVTKSCQSVNQIPVTFTIITTNSGPGAAINPTLSDTLPDGFTYDGYTSKLYTNGVPANLGTCTYSGPTTDLFTCALNTPLPEQSESSAYWEVVINLTAVTSTQLSNTVTVSSITTDPNTSNNTSTATCGTTAVTLLSFDASVIDGKVTLDWETASELNTLGFNLYKSVSADSEKEKLNESLLPSNVMPGTLQGAVYTFTAGDAATGEYYFWLEEVDVSGGTTFYGPAVLIITD